MTDLRTTSATAYLALSAAADRMAEHNFGKLPPTVQAKMVKGHVPSGTAWPTTAHRDVMDAMLDVMNGRSTVEDAMALLWRSDVEAERFGHR